MHLAVVDHYADVACVGAGEGTLLHAVHEALDDGGDEAGVDGAAYDAVIDHELAAPLQGYLLLVADIELELLAAELVGVGLGHAFGIRLDDEVPLAELAGAAGLFLVAVVGACGLGDGLAVWNLGLVELDRELVVVLDSPLEGSEVELALALDKHLLEFLALLPDPGGVLLVHAGENDGKLLGVGLVDRLDGTGVLGGRVLDEVELVLAAFLVESVAGVDVLELDGGADVACAELVDALAHLSADDVELGEALLGALAGDVLDIVAGMERATHDLEVVDLADVGLDAGLEDKEAQGTVGLGLYGLAGDGDGSGHLGDEWADVAKELHHAAHAHVLEGADDEYGIDAAVDESLADAFAHLVLGQGAFLEELVHEGLVVLGGSLDEGIVELLGAVHEVGGDVGDGGSSAVGTPFELLHEKDVDEGVETGTCLHGELHGHNLRAEDFAHLLHEVVVVGLLAVYLVEGEEHGLAELLGGAEYVACAYFHAVLGVEDDDAGIAYTEGSVSVAHEVVGSGAVNHVELLAVELAVEHCREHAVAVLLLYGEVVADSVLGLDGAAALDDSTLQKHGLRECGFSRAFASEQGYVLDFVGVVGLHM